MVPYGCCSGACSCDGSAGTIRSLMSWWYLLLWWYGGWQATQRGIFLLRARQQQHALALQKLPKSRRGSFDCYSFQQLTRNTVVMVNMNELHTLDAIPPAQADFARQIVDDLGVCIMGGKASNHSLEMIPAYSEVHQKLSEMVRRLELPE